MKKFVNLTLALVLVLSIAMFGMMSTARAEGTVPNPSGQDDGSCGSDDMLSIGIATFQMLQGQSNCHWFAHRVGDNGGVVIFNPGNYTGEFFIEVCFVGKGPILVTLPATADHFEYSFFAQTYFVGNNQSCTQLWVHGGEKFELVSWNH